MILVSSVVQMKDESYIYFAKFGQRDYYCIASMQLSLGGFVKRLRWYWLVEKISLDRLFSLVLGDCTVSTWCSHKYSCGTHCLMATWPAGLSFTELHQVMSTNCLKVMQLKSKTLQNYALVDCDTIFGRTNFKCFESKLFSFSDWHQTSERGCFTQGQRGQVRIIGNI